MADNQTMGDQGTAASTLFVQRLITGSASRISRYREYDQIANDCQISRALDTIAEEMTGSDPNSDMPLVLDIVVEKKESIPSHTVMTLKAALQYWCDLHDWETRLFKVARVMVMYGDCFFIRKADTRKWEFVHPRNVVAAIVDEKDMTQILGWQIKTDTKEPNNTGAPALGYVGRNTEQQTQVLAANEVVWFSNNDDCSETAPFGESVLRPIYKVQKQKELLEDASIIYRLQRAPEKRVFYVDVGKLHPSRQKAYLEQYKNEIRQRKVPSVGGGVEQVDAVYNSQSMLEDFFIATKEGSRGSRIEVLPTNANWNSLDELEYFNRQVLEGLRVPMSYLREGEGAATTNDGKVGISYIHELRFALFVKRLQRYLEKVLDKEFKRYLRAAGIRIDTHFFKIRLPDPENFGIYRQQELNTNLLNTLSTAMGINTISPRFAMKKYGGMTDEEIILNERFLKEEKGIDPDDNSKEHLQTLYSQHEGAMGMGGDMGGMDMMPPGEGPSTEEPPTE